MFSQTRKVSSVALPLSYLLPGITVFLLANLLFVFWNAAFQNFFFREPRVLVLTHILTLGWITLAMFGAMLQIVPVLLEVVLLSQMLGIIQLVLYLLGIVGLVISFAVMKTNPFGNVFGGLIAISSLLFIVNMAGTLLRVKKWDYVGYYLLSSLVYFAATVLAGVIAVQGLSGGIVPNPLAFMKAHAHLALLGWVSITILGVSCRLIPMFSLSHGFSETPGKVCLIFWNVGTVLLFLGLLVDTAQWLVKLSSLIIGIGVILYALQMRNIFSKRGRRKLDVGLLYVIAAVISLLVLALLGIAFSFGLKSGDYYLRYAYGYLALLGWASFYIVGQLYKIVPFLSWHRKYSEKMGKEKVPLMKDMLNEKLAEVQFWMMVPGVLGVAVGLALNIQWMIVSFGCVVLASSIIFAYGMADSLRR